MHIFVGYFSVNRAISPFAEKYKHFLIIKDLDENSYLCTPAGRLDLTIGRTRNRTENYGNDFEQ